jgi:hypothetical protein
MSDENSMQQLEGWAPWSGSYDSDHSLSVPRALRDAMRFLLSRQDSDGAWRDFRVKPGRSDAWVTAYVGDRLSQVARHWSIRVDGAIMAAARFLDTSRDRAGGWGYNSRCDADSDTTAQTIMFLRQAGGRARLFDYATLAKFQRPDGSFATYQIRDLRHGWGRGHPDVTAVALRALGTVLPSDHVILLRGFASLADHLRGPDPLASYWWSSRAYLARELLLLVRALPKAPSISLRHISVVDSGGCFDQALALEVAVLCGDPPDRLAPLARRLEALQCPDGSWPTIPILRITNPRSEEFGDDYFRSSPTFCDDRRLFTTATALTALSSAERLMTGLLAT